MSNTKRLENLERSQNYNSSFGQESRDLLEELKQMQFAQLELETQQEEPTDESTV